MPTDDRHVAVEDRGKVAATADIHTNPEEDLVQAQLHVEAGHHHPGLGAELVDVVLQEAAVGQQTRLQVTLPAGEAESLARLRERCEDVQTRQAGATVIVECALPAH